MSRGHQEEIARAVRGWTRGSLVSTELKKLPEVLRDSEHLENVDRAQQGGRTGLLAATDERLLFLNSRPLRGLEVEAYEYDELREMRIEASRVGRTKRLVLDLASDQVTFKGLDAVRAERIAEWVKPKIGKRGPVRVPGERTGADVIAELKAALGKVGAVVGTPALPRIADAIGRGEQIGPAIVGSLGATPGVLVTTDRRMVFAAVDPRRPLQEWDYADIERIDVVPSVKWSTLSIQAAPEPASVTTTANARAEALAEHVRGRLDAEPRQERPPALEPVDVNAADAAALSAALGITAAQAERAVEIRERQGPFGSVDAFVAALELEPHEEVRVHERAAAVEPAEPQAPKVEPPPPPPSEQGDDMVAF